MSRHVFKLPDLGEGTVEAEIVAWHVKPGDVVAEDDVIVEVMTDKAAVEVPSPVSGKVISTTGNPGESVPVGSELIVFETAEGGHAKTAASVPGPEAARAAPAAGAESGAGAARTGATTQAGVAAVARTDSHARAGATALRSTNGAGNPSNGRVATSPAIRRRAHEAGVDLSQVRGSGPNGRIVREDFDAFVERQVGRGGRHARAT